MSHRVGLVFSVFKERLRLAGTSGRLVQPLLQQGNSEHPGCPGPCSERFWIYLGIDPPQPLRVTCSIPWSLSQWCDQREPPVFHLSSLPLGHHWKSPRHFFNPSFRYLYPFTRFPWASPVSWAVPGLSATPQWNFQYYFPAFYFSRHLQT